MDYQKIQAHLRKPFPIADTHWRVMNVTGDKTRGSCAYYIDARNVMERLDEVFGPRWNNSNKVLVSDRTWTVECTIHAQYVDAGCYMYLSHTDVGIGEDAKEAYSDALKRAAVHYGIFRYGYDLPVEWYPLDNRGNFTAEAQATIRKRLAEHIGKPATVENNVPVTWTEAPPAPDDDLWEPNPPPPPKKVKAAEPLDADVANLINAALTFQQEANLPERVGDMAEWVGVQHLESVNRAGDAILLSEKAYGFMAALLDKRYGEKLGSDAHHLILAALLAYPVDREHRPGYKTNALIDWINKPDENTEKLGLLDTFVEKLGDYLTGQKELL